MTELAEEYDEQETFEVEDQIEAEADADETAEDDAEEGSEAEANVVVTIGEEAPPPKMRKPSVRLNGCAIFASSIVRKNVVAKSLSSSWRGCLARPPGP